MMKICFISMLVVATMAMNIAVHQDMVAEINAKQNSWVAEENHITRMPLEEAVGLLGINVKQSAPLPETKTFTQEQMDSVPTAFDPRDKWPQCKSIIGHIRNQKHCGSCWAFGAVEAMSDRVCIETGEKVLLSAEDMNSCSGSCGSCNGGYPSCAWNYWKSSGIVSDNCYPYSAGNNDSEIVTPPCLAKCTGNKTKDYKSDKHYGATSYSVSGESRIKTEIYNNGPVECAFTVYRDFYAYKSGVYHRTSYEYLGGHAVKMVGWGVENGEKYWLCANSWDVTWGMEGFFKIRRGTNECSIESTVWAGTAQKY